MLTQKEYGKNWYKKKIILFGLQSHSIGWDYIVIYRHNIKIFVYINDADYKEDSILSRIKQRESRHCHWATMYT